MSNPKTPEPETEYAVNPLEQALGPSEIEKFLGENKLLLGGALLLLVLVVSGLIVGRGLSDAARDKAARAYTAAENVAQLDLVAQDFEGTVVGGNALIRKAAMLEDEGTMEEARTTLLGFIDRYPDHPRRAQALIILARYAIEEGDPAKAKDFLIQIGDNSELVPLVRLQLGDLAFQDGKFEEARGIYESIARSSPDHPWLGEWNQRMTAVNEKLTPADVVSLPSPEAPATAEPTEASPEATENSAAPAPEPAPAPPTAEAIPEAPAPEPAPEPSGTP